MYAELAYQQKKVETWLPVTLGEAGMQFEKLALFYGLEITSGPVVEVLSSILLYSLTFVLLGAILLVFRRQNLRPVL